jgi:hypothetical protein
MNRFGIGLEEHGDPDLLLRRFRKQAHSCGIKWIQGHLQHCCRMVLRSVERLARIDVKVDAGYAYLNGSERKSPSIVGRQARATERSRLAFEPWHFDLTLEGEGDLLVEECGVVSLHAWWSGSCAHPERKRFAFREDERIGNGCLKITGSYPTPDTNTGSSCFYRWGKHGYRLSVPYRPARTIYFVQRPLSQRFLVSATPGVRSRA